MERDESLLDGNETEDEERYESAPESLQDGNETENEESYELATESFQDDNGTEDRVEDEVTPQSFQDDNETEYNDKDEEPPQSLRDDNETEDKEKNESTPQSFQDDNGTEDRVKDEATPQSFQDDNGTEDRVKDEATPQSLHDDNKTEDEGRHELAPQSLHDDNETEDEERHELAPQSLHDEIETEDGEKHELAPQSLHDDNETEDEERHELAPQSLHDDIETEDEERHELAPQSLHDDIETEDEERHELAPQSLQNDNETEDEERHELAPQSLRNDNVTEDKEKNESTSQSLRDDFETEDKEREVTPTTLMNVSIGSSAGDPTTSNTNIDTGLPEETTEKNGENSSPIDNVAVVSSSTEEVRRVQSADSGIPAPKSELAYRQQKFLQRSSKKVEDIERFGHFLVEANYFKINLKEDVSVEKYHIDLFTRRGGFWSLEKKKERIQALFYEMVSQNAGSFPLCTLMVYNGNDILYSKMKLKNLFGIEQGTFTLRGTKQRFGRQSSATPDIEMEIKYTGKVMIRVSDRLEEKNELSSFINLLVTMRLRCPLSNASKYFKPHGHSLYFAPDDVTSNIHYIDLGDNKQAVAGLHGAVKTDCEAGLLYNIDVSHSVFTKAKVPLVIYICERYERMPLTEQKLAELQRMLLQQGNFFLRNNPQVERWLRGMSVVTDYSGTRKHKIKKVSRESATQLMFSIGGGSISVAEYFLNQYGTRLRFSNLPCVDVGKRNSRYPVWVPLELCYAEPKVQRVNSESISNSQRGYFIRSIQKTPEMRRNVIDQMCNPTEGVGHPEHISAQDDWMAEFGVSVEKQFIQVKATLLPPPRLVYGNSLFQDTDHLGQWSLTDKEMRLRTASESTTNVVAGLLFVGREYSKIRITNIAPFQHLMSVLKTFGVNVLSTSPFNTYHWDSDQGLGKLRNLLNTWKTNVITTYKSKGEEVLPLVIAVFPTKCAGKTFGTDSQSCIANFNEYAVLKHTAELEVNIHTQCLLMSTYQSLSGTTDATTSLNIAMKILGKIGVRLYKLDNNITDTSNHKPWANLVAEPTLILGVDVTHPGVQERLEAEENGTKASSVACVIGNLDQEISMFGASYRVQYSGEEMLLNLDIEFRERIMEFFETTKKAPAHIVIYRDGVSESMFEKTLFEEKASLLRACSSISQDLKPTFTYIVMTKRHHTRFMALKEDLENQQAPCGNLKPGTLIESGVTSSKFFDFYLYSQHGAIGTSRPNHYYILDNDWKTSTTNFFQHITYALTFLNIRCCRSVSQPAPVMYAHLGAKRAKEYVDAQAVIFEEKRNNLRNQMSDRELQQMRTEHMRFLTCLLIRNTDLKGMLFV